MDQLAAPSPFSTRESRDKYIRPPLTNYDSDFNDSTVVEQETAASSSSSKKSNRRSRGGGASSVSVPASVYSPPISSTFATSSPAREGDNLKTLTPGLSMIQGSSPMSDKPVKRITSRDRRAVVTSPAPQIDHDPGSQDEETTDSDDEQPSLRTRSKTEATGSPNNSSTKNKSKICITNRSFGRNLSGSSKHQLSHSEVPSKATLESASVEASQHLLCGCLVPIVLGMVIALICIYSSLPGQNFLFVQSPLVQNDQAFWNASIKKLREDLGLLSRKEFPGQDEHSWPVLRASIRSVLKEDPHMPSVILMVSDESGAPTAKCLAQKIGCEVNKLLEKDSGAECLGVESGKFSERSDLFTAMETRLVSGSSASFTLFNIQDLSGNTAMALHAFCDNDSAPFKQASIVMTLIAPDDVFNNEDTTQDIADKVLSEAWGKDLDSDRVSPILSRVVISAVKVAQESAIPC